MKCPKCDEEMDYEEIKWPSGYFYCDCGHEVEGERFAIPTSEGDPIDYEERITQA